MGDSEADAKRYGPLDQDVTWNIGEKVVFIPPRFGPPQYWPATVDKIYKNGNLLVNRLRFRVHGDVGHQTGEGYGGAMIRKLTPEIAARMKEQTIVRRWNNAVEALRGIKFEADTVPTDLMEAIEERLRTEFADKK